MVFEKTRMDKGKKQAVLAVEEDDIAANGSRCRRVQNGLEAEVELLRRQLEASTEQLRKDRKIQQQYYQHDTAESVALYEDYEQPFVHIPRRRQESNLVRVQPKMANQNWESRFEIEFLEFDGSLGHKEFVDWLLAKLKRSLLVMIFQNPRKLNWQQLI